MEIILLICIIFGSIILFFFLVGILNEMFNKYDEDEEDGDGQKEYKEKEDKENDDEDGDNFSLSSSSRLLLSTQFNLLTAQILH
jgi:flagellar biosynthesis/type III secretory pathway M-ring protein FliF/YscJ